jgi:hypothetical protein
MLERDWTYLEEASANLEDYLLSSQLYYPLGGFLKKHSDQGLLQLTLGNVLVTLARLQAITWSGEEAQRLDQFQDQVNDIRQRWRSNWILKAEKEFPARLNLWQTCIRDWAAGEEHTLTGYRHQVRWRVILHLLCDEPSMRYHEETMLTGLDSRLRQISHTGPFVWEKELETGFPKSIYWYLYLSI